MRVASPWKWRVSRMPIAAADSSSQQRSNPGTWPRRKATMGSSCRRQARVARVRSAVRVPSASRQLVMFTVTTPGSVEG